MVSNPQRRDELCDAGLRVVAQRGVGGLTHRAVDREADVPIGTSSNYFRTRDHLLGALAERILERLAPDPEEHDPLATMEPSVDVLVAYVEDIYQRAMANADLMLALFELRLEATRRPELARILTSTLTESFRADVAFNASAGLPGEELEIALLHFAMDGLLFDQLTTSLAPNLDRRELIQLMVDRLVNDEIG